MSRRLHHVGVVVASVDAVGDALGPTILRFHDKTQRVRVRFVGTERGLIELIEPAADDSPVSATLAKGGGLHHLAFEVDDFQKACAAMRQNNAIPLGPAWQGFENRWLAFFMPRGAQLPEEIVGPRP